MADSERPIECALGMCRLCCAMSNDIFDDNFAGDVIRECY